MMEDRHHNKRSKTNITPGSSSSNAVSQGLLITEPKRKPVHRGTPGWALGFAAFSFVKERAEHVFSQAPETSKLMRFLEKNARAFKRQQIELERAHPGAAVFSDPRGPAPMPNDTETTATGCKYLAYFLLLEALRTRNWEILQTAPSPITAVRFCRFLVNSSEETPWKIPLPHGGFIKLSSAETYIKTAFSHLTFVYPSTDLLQVPGVRAVLSQIKAAKSPSKSNPGFTKRQVKDLIRLALQPGPSLRTSMLTVTTHPEETLNTFAVCTAISFCGLFRPNELLLASVATKNPGRLLKWGVDLKFHRLKPEFENLGPVDIQKSRNTTERVELGNITADTRVDVVTRVWPAGVGEKGRTTAKSRNIERSYPIWKCEKFHIPRMLRDMYLSTKSHGASTGKGVFNYRDRHQRWRGMSPKIYNNILREVAITSDEFTPKEARSASAKQLRSGGASESSWSEFVRGVEKANATTTERGRWQGDCGKMAMYNNRPIEIFAGVTGEMLNDTTSDGEANIGSMRAMRSSPKGSCRQ